jgi:tRNA modification GTPase
MLRNKIDVLNQPLGKNETEIIIIDKTEPKNSPNNPLKNMVNNPSIQRNEHPSGEDDPRFDISAQTGEGIEPLLTALAAQAERMLAGAESALLTRERHRRALGDALAALQRALALSGREDLLAEELRAAGQALGRLTGRVDVEDVLDVIFRDFCIGK